MEKYSSMKNPEKKLIDSLTPEWKKVANITRLAILSVFIIVSITIIFMILFPSQIFEFSFQNYSAMKNTIVNPRIGDLAIEKGKLPKETSLDFDTDLIGDFSHVEISMTLDKKSSPLQAGKINVRKSYRAFFYPEGAEMALPSGLLITADGKYWIVSGTELREFKNSSTMQQLGFSKQMFLSVEQQAIDSMPQGEIISSMEYPESSFFLINGEYYQLLKGQLVKFVSKNAFLSVADTRQAIEKSEDFLNEYRLSEGLLGFRDGTIVSSEESVYLLSKGKRYPVDNTFTFQAMGYAWNDVVPVTAEELSLYEKQKLFTQASPHPDGTVFSDRKTGKYYVISDGKKSPISDQNIAQAYLRGTSPVFADIESLDISQNCILEKNFGIFSRKYSCTIPIEALREFPGNDYQFKMTSSSEIKLDHAETEFKKVIGRGNMLSSLADLKRRISNTYYGPIN